MARNPHSVLDEPAFTVPARGKPEHAAWNETVFSTPVRGKDAAEHEVWSEPCLMAGAEAPDPEQTQAGILRQRWRDATWTASWLALAGIAAVAGPFAMLAAFLKTSSPGLVVAAVVVAPLVEELGKAAAPLMLLERKPYVFKAGYQPLLACVASALVFATVENMLYLFVYAREHGEGYAAWRWTVCTALHAGCSLVAGLGLRRLWATARDTGTRPDPGGAAPYFIAAMVLHGGYNAMAILLQATGLLPFGR